MKELKKELKEQLDISIDEIPENLVSRIQSDLDYYKKLKKQLSSKELSKEQREHLASIVCAIDNSICELLFPSHEDPICQDCGLEERECNCKEDY